ncbi:MAG: cytochrome c biogenesis heme-transporting ATPase CcmA [Gammaproteobacteria bacterium]|nr:cytochrome c biogenesis heme-transporting ATPase CcmA [Gammaproteobacteria bacterium]
MQAKHGIAKLPFLQNHCCIAFMSSAARPHQPDTVASLAAVDIRCQRGERTLFSGLELSLERGQCLHIAGANGSGKTTLLRTVCGLRKADEGHVRWQGKDINDNHDFARAVAYLGHKDGLKDALSPAENLQFYQQLDGVLNTTLIDSTLQRMQLLQCADLATVNLSFGQRRRLAFARLLLQRKSLWILDEPFTGIDIAGRDLVEQICLEHLAADGMILLTSHQSLDHSSLASATRVVTL